MIRVASIAPVKERCGIADYMRLHAGLFPEDIQIINVSLPDVHEPQNVWKEAARKANTADLAHVQFEYGLFDPVKPFRNRYTGFMRALHPARVVTLHDHFPVLRPRWRHGAPKGLKDVLRDMAYLPHFRNWERRLFGCASHYIVHTEELRDQAAAHAGKAHVSYLPMPIPSAQAQWEGSQSSSPCLITPGFVKPHKGYDEFLELVAEHESWRWIIAGGAQDEGDASYLDDLKASIIRRQLSGRTEITGYLSRGEMERHMSRATMAVFPFRRTAGSSSIAWAVAAGMPVAASDLPAVRSMRQAGAGIELIPTGDMGTWAARLGDLLRDRASLSTLAQRNRAYARSCGFDRLAASIAGIYRSLR